MNQVFRLTSDRAAIVNVALPWQRLNDIGIAQMQASPPGAKVLLINERDRVAIVGTAADAASGHFTHMQGLPHFDTVEAVEPSQVEHLKAQWADANRHRAELAAARDNALRERDEARQERDKARTQAAAMRQELHKLRNPPKGPTFEERKAARVDANTYKARAERAEQRAHNLQMSLEDWNKKTEWVQQAARPQDLGKHRADVIRTRIAEFAERVEAYRARAEAAEVLAAFTKAGHDMQARIVQILAEEAQKIADSREEIATDAAALAQGWAVVFPAFVADILAHPRRLKDAQRAALDGAVKAFERVTAEDEKPKAAEQAAPAEGVPA